MDVSSSLHCRLRAVFQGCDDELPGQLPDPPSLIYSEVIPGLADDPTVRAVVLKSDTKGFFLAHFDVDYLAHQWKPMRAGELSSGHWWLFPYHAMGEQLRTMPKPTIAMINGRVGGGGSELALSCDMRFAGPDAMFNQPEVALGILPGGSGTVRLPRLCGRSRAMEIILGSDDFTATEAAAYGGVLAWDGVRSNQCCSSDHDSFQQPHRLGQPRLPHRRGSRGPRRPSRSTYRQIRTQRRG